MEIETELMDESEKRLIEEIRPWGGFVVLDDQPTYKVKRMWVNPGHRLSYQKHRLRSEHWMIVKGEAKVTLDRKEIYLKEGEYIDIPISSAHRIENIGSDLLTFIEIQRGDSFSEDDVIRLEDDYGRATESQKA